MEIAIKDKVVVTNNVLNNMCSSNNIDVLINEQISYFGFRINYFHNTTTPTKFFLHTNSKQFNHYLITKPILL